MTFYKIMYSITGNPDTPTELSENQDLSLTVSTNPNNGDFELSTFPYNYSGISFKEKNVDNKK